MISGRIGIVLLVVLVGLAGCAVPRAPLMLCAQVAPNLMACMDHRDYQDRQEPADEPLLPKLQRHPSPPTLPAPMTGPTL